MLGFSFFTSGSDFPMVTYIVSENHGYSRSVVILIQFQAYLCKQVSRDIVVIHYIMVATRIVGCVSVTIS